jgi:hypothetical protein
MVLVRRSCGVAPQKAIQQKVMLHKLSRDQAIFRKTVPKK